MRMWPLLDGDPYDQDKLEYKDTNDQIEGDDLITVSHVSDALWYRLIDLWTVNPHSLDKSPLPNFSSMPEYHQRQVAVNDNQILPQLPITADGLTRVLPLSANFSSKEIAKSYNCQWSSKS